MTKHPSTGSTANDQLTHFDESGQAHMVDVGAKESTHRIAVAEGKIRMQASTLEMITQGNSKKGDVLGIARIKTICSTKKFTSNFNSYAKH